MGPWDMTSFGLWIMVANHGRLIGGSIGDLGVRCNKTTLELSKHSCR